MAKSKKPYTFRMTDPTHTSTKRLYYIRQMNKNYRAYGKNVAELIRANPDISVFVSQVNKFTVQTNLAGHVISDTMVNDAFDTGRHRADLIAQSIVVPAKAEIPQMIPYVKGALGPADMKTLELLQMRSFENIVGYTADMEKKYKYVMTNGLLEGKGANTMAREAAKLTKSELYKAERIVRTEMNSSFNKSAFSRYEDYGFTHYMISVEAAEPACEICPPMIGKVFKFGSGPVPPLHPNCRCSIYPVDINKE